VPLILVGEGTTVTSLIRWRVGSNGVEFDRIDRLPFAANDAALSRDGKWVIFSSQDGVSRSVKRYTIADGSIITLATTSMDEVPASKRFTTDMQTLYINYARSSSDAWELFTIPVSGGERVSTGIKLRLSLTDIRTDGTLIGTFGYTPNTSVVQISPGSTTTSHLTTGAVGTMGCGEAHLIFYRMIGSTPTVLRRELSTGIERVIVSNAIWPQSLSPC
jgi:hypothetical protein